MTIILLIECVQKNPQNDLLSVGWDVKPYQLAHSPQLTAITHCKAKQSCNKTGEGLYTHQM